MVPEMTRRQRAFVQIMPRELELFCHFPTLPTIQQEARATEDMSEDHKRVYPLIFLPSQDSVTLPSSQRQLTLMRFVSMKRGITGHVGTSFTRWCPSVCPWPHQNSKAEGNDEFLPREAGAATWRAVPWYSLQTAILITEKSSHFFWWRHWKSFPINEQLSTLQLHRSGNGRSSNPAQSHCPVPVIFF